MSKQRMLTRKEAVSAGAGLAVAALGARAAAGLTGTQTAAAAAQRSAAAPQAPSAAGLLPAERIGIQLYSVRDQIGSFGFAPVFKTLAAIGYKYVEFAGYTQGTGPITTKQIRQLMDANGLKGIGSHAISVSAMPLADAQFEQALDDAQTLGLPQIGISFVVPDTMTTASWQSLAKQFNHYGQLAAARGLKFYLHNHFFEWTLCADDPTKRGEDILLAETDPNLVWFEMDIYWAYVGQWQSGQVVTFDPLRDYLLPNRARYLLFHIKDGKPDQTTGYTDALDDIVDDGEGNIDFITFFSTLFAQASGEQNRHWYIQERDNASSHPRGSLAASQMSYLYLRYGIAKGMSFGGIT